MIPTKKTKEDLIPLIRQYKDKVYRLIRRMVLIHEDADDLVQETFIKAWKNWDQFKGKSEAGTWLYRIAVNEALQFLRKKKRLGISYSLETQEVWVKAIENSPALDGDEIQKALQKSLLQLPDQQRLVFHLRYYEDKSFAEISAITGKTEGGLKANYHHAVKKIKKIMNLD